MKLLIEELKKHVPPLYSRKNVQDPLVVCKFFDPVGSWAWYVIEGSPVDKNGEPCLDAFLYESLRLQKMECVGCGQCTLSGICISRRADYQK